MSDEYVSRKLNRVSIRMVKEPPLLSPVPMDSPQAAIRVLADFMKDSDRELFCVVSCNAKLKPINMSVVSIGALNESIAHPREILKPVLLQQDVLRPTAVNAVTDNAASMILFHFHPSGHLEPSQVDIALTDRMNKVGDLVGIPVLDHIICGPGDSYYSFHERGVLPLSDLQLTTSIEDIHLQGFGSKVAESMQGMQDGVADMSEQVAKIGYPVTENGELQKETATGKVEAVDLSGLTGLSRNEQVKQITENLQNQMEKMMDSTVYKNWLTSLSRFHNYSLNNTILIAMQKPNATLVASYTTWRKMGRYVEKGQKGLTILAPAPYKKQKERDVMDPATGKPKLGKDGKPLKEKYEITIPAFKPCKVFDLDQTGGKELPTLGVHELKGDVKGYENMIQALHNIARVPITEEDIPSGAKGYYSKLEDRIAIQKGMSQVQTIKTLIHELSHSELDNHEMDMLVKAGKMQPKDRATREVIAESIAHVCCSRWGISTDDYTFGYLASYSSGRDLKELKSNMETIRSKSAEIIKRVEEELDAIELAQEKKPSLDIYQLKNEEGMLDLRFEDLEWLKRKGFEVDVGNYDKVYSGEWKDGETLEDIYERFNIDHPDDFTGHSLSVSDVVVLHQDGDSKAYYVDSVGFQELSGFVREKPVTMEEHKEAVETPEQMAVAVGDRYILIQETEGGYDYSIYDDNFRLLDGGVLDMENSSIEYAMKDIVFDLDDQGKLQKDSEIKFMDYEELARKVTEAEQTEITYIVSECNEFPGLGFYETDIKDVGAAVEAYEGIDPKRMNAIPSIAMNVHTKGTDTVEDIQLDLIVGNTIDTDILRYVPDLKDNHQVQSGLTELISYFPNKNVNNQALVHQIPTEYKRDTALTLATAIDQFIHDFDPRGYQNAIENRDANITAIQNDINAGRRGYLTNYLRDIVQDTGCLREDQQAAATLLKRMEQYEKVNPIAHIEMLEEDNLNMIDGVLNNSSPKEPPEQKAEKVAKTAEKKEKSTSRKQKSRQKASLQERLKAKKAMVAGSDGQTGRAEHREVN